MLHELELLDEKCLDALNHLQAYQDHLRRSYHKKIKNQKFEVGNIVLMENQKNLQERPKKGKFEPNWLGPYVITTSYGSGAYQLATPEGKTLDEPMNILHLKKFYA